MSRWLRWFMPVLMFVAFVCPHGINSKNEDCAFIGLVGAPTAPASSFRLICFVCPL